MIDLMNKMYENRGNCVDEDGDVVAMPTGGFPIVAGAWPNRHLGAIQVRCEICNRFAGLSPKGLAIHREQPEQRPIWCARCWEELLALAQMQERKPVH